MMNDLKLASSGITQCMPQRKPFFLALPSWAFSVDITLRTRTDSVVSISPLQVKKKNRNPVSDHRRVQGEKKKAMFWVNSIYLHLVQSRKTRPESNWISM